MWPTFERALAGPAAHVRRGAHRTCPRQRSPAAQAQRGGGACARKPGPPAPPPHLSSRRQLPLAALAAAAAASAPRSQSAGRFAFSNTNGRRSQLGAGAVQHQRVGGLGRDRANLPGDGAKGRRGTRAANWRSHIQPFEPFRTILNHLKTRIASSASCQLPRLDKPHWTSTRDPAIMQPWPTRARGSLSRGRGGSKKKNVT
jgi:hypothetical protein